MQETSNIEFKYNGKVYQSVYSRIYTCEGCVFEEDEEGCMEANTIHGCRDAIWQEKQGDNSAVTTQQGTEMTWTLDEIEVWYSEWVNGEGLSNSEKQGLLDIKRDALRKQDPEYQKYLELKAKFGE